MIGAIFVKVLVFLLRVVVTGVGVAVISVLTYSMSPRPAFDRDKKYYDKKDKRNDKRAIIGSVITGAYTAWFVFSKLLPTIVQETISKESWAQILNYVGALAFLMLGIIIFLWIISNKHVSNGLTTTRRLVSSLAITKNQLAKATKNSIIADVQLIADKEKGYYSAEFSNQWTDALKTDGSLHLYTKRINPNYNFSKKIADDIYIYFPSFISLMTQYKDTKSETAYDEICKILTEVIGAEYKLVRSIIIEDERNIRKARETTDAGLVSQSKTDLEYFRKQKNITRGDSND